MGVSTRYSYGTPIRIHRLSTVYLPYIYRISTVVNSGKIAETSLTNKVERMLNSV